MLATGSKGDDGVCGSVALLCMRTEIWRACVGPWVPASEGARKRVKASRNFHRGRLLGIAPYSLLVSNGHCGCIMNTSVQ